MATRVEFVWFSNASSNCLPEQMQIRTHCICLLFTTMCFQMHYQIVCPRKCIVASIAFVWFFSTVYSQMLPPIVCITWSMITHTLHDYMLKRFLSRMGHCGIPCAFSKRCHILTTPNTVKMCCGVVHFQMCPQTSDKMGNYENDGTPQDSRAV